MLISSAQTPREKLQLSSFERKKKRLISIFLIQLVILNRINSLVYTQLNSKGFFKIKHCNYNLHHMKSKEHAFSEL